MLLNSQQPLLGLAVKVTRWQLHAVQPGTENWLRGDAKKVGSGKVAMTAHLNPRNSAYNWYLIKQLFRQTFGSSNRYKCVKATEKLWKPQICKAKTWIKQKGGKINNNNKIKLQLVQQILWPKQRTTKGALRLDWKIPCLNSKVPWSQDEPLKIVFPVLLQNENRLFSINLSLDICTAIPGNIYKGWDPEKDKNHCCLKAWRLAQKVFAQLEELSAEAAQTARLPQRSICCSRSSVV